jgi:hypothetical protein
MGYELGDRWSAASEGVLAALRLSKSAQSADKVHFSDSTEPPVFEVPEFFSLYQLLAVTIDQHCSVSIKSSRFLSYFGEELDQKSYLWPGNRSSVAYRADNATGQLDFTNGSGFRPRVHVQPLNGRHLPESGAFTGRRAQRPVAAR